MSTAFVLSGGASLGAVQAGMLQALYEHRIEPDLLVGTSVGALNAAFVATRPQSVQTAAALADAWRGVRRFDVFPPSPLTGLIGFLGRRNHLVSNAGLRRLVERHLRLERLEDADVALHVVAADLYTGEEVRLSSGPVVEAVLASSAIPGVFEPVAWEGTDLIDGGVANNTPISHALELGATEVYVLPTGSACALEEPPRGALAMSLHAMTLLVQRRLQADIATLSDDARLIVLPPPCPQAVQPIDFGHSQTLVDRARDDARAFLADRRPRRPTRALPVAA